MFTIHQTVVINDPGRHAVLHPISLRPISTHDPGRLRQRLNHLGEPRDGFISSRHVNTRTT